MADLSELLSSISDEDMEKIKSVASSLMSDSRPAEKSNNNALFDDGTMNNFMSVMNKLNKEDDRTRLLNDLKPLLSEERRKKADEAIKFLHLMELMPLVRGMFRG